MFGTIQLTPFNPVQDDFAAAFSLENAAGLADARNGSLSLTDLFDATSVSVSSTETVEFFGSYDGNFIFGTAQDTSFTNGGTVMGIVDLGLGDDSYFGSDASFVDGGIELGVGNDIAETGMADDMVYGGLGDDLIDGGAGNDVLVGDDTSTAEVQALLASLGL